MLPTWLVSLLQAGRITHYTAIIETPVSNMEKKQWNLDVLNLLIIESNFQLPW